MLSKTALLRIAVRVANAHQSTLDMVLRARIIEGNQGVPLNTFTGSDTGAIIRNIKNWFLQNKPSKFQSEGNPWLQPQVTGLITKAQAAIFSALRGHGKQTETLELLTGYVYGINPRSSQRESSNRLYNTGAGVSEDLAGFGGKLEPSDFTSKIGNSATQYAAQYIRDVVKRTESLDEFGATDAEGEEFASHITYEDMEYLSDYQDSILDDLDRVEEFVGTGLLRYRTLQVGFWIDIVNIIKEASSEILSYLEDLPRETPAEKAFYARQKKNSQKVVIKLDHIQKLFVPYIQYLQSPAYNPKNPDTMVQIVHSISDPESTPEAVNTNRVQLIQLINKVRTLFIDLRNDIGPFSETVPAMGGLHQKLWKIILDLANKIRTLDEEKKNAKSDEQVLLEAIAEAEKSIEDNKKEVENLFQEFSKRELTEEEMKIWENLTEEIQEANTAILRMDAKLRLLRSKGK